MPAFTAHLNLYLPGGGSTGIGGDDEAVDIDKINGNFQALDTWSADKDAEIDVLNEQNTRNQQFNGPASSLGSLTGMKNGDEYQETDGARRRWLYDGSNWVTGEHGLYLIRPSSVTNGSVHDDGRILFSGGQSSISVLGCFSSRFRVYEVDFVLRPSAAAGTQLQLLNGSTPYSGATYSSQRIQSVGSGGVVSSTQLNQTSWPGAGLTGSGSNPFVQGRWMFTNPAASGSPKFVDISVTQAPSPGMADDRGFVAGVDSTVFTGFRLSVTGQTLGADSNAFMKIYGRP